MATSRGQGWSHEEILCLIRIWSDQSIQNQLDGATRTADVYRRITQKLLESGYDRTMKQCKDKLKNLKQFYKELKDGHNRSGFDRSTWPYYDLLDAVLGDRPATRPDNVVDTTIGDTNSETRNELATGESTTDTTSLQGSLSLQGSDVEDEEVEGDSEDVASGVVQQKRPARGVSTSRSKRRSSGLEKVLTGMTDTFMAYQKDMEERMIRLEAERQKQEMEALERMRKEDREHELRLFSILGQFMVGQYPQASPPLSPPPGPSLYYAHPPSTPVPPTTSAPLVPPPDPSLYYAHPPSTPVPPTTSAPLVPTPHMHGEYPSTN